MIAALFALASSSAVRPLGAAPSRVAIYTGLAERAVAGEVAQRLHAELMAAGFEVVVVEGTPDLDPGAQVAFALGRAPAFAAIAVIRAERGAVADIWVADRATRAAEVRRLEVEPGQLDAPSALAVRAVELVRAARVELTTTPSVPALVVMTAPTPVAVAPWSPGAPAQALATPLAAGGWPGRAVARPAVESPAAPVAGAGEPPFTRVEPERRGLHQGFFVEAAAAALIAFGDLGESMTPLVRVGYGGAAGLAGRVTLIGPKASVQLEAAAGTASVREELALLELAHAFEPRGAVTPIVSIGVGAYHARVEGRAAAGYDAHEEDVWAAAGVAGVGLAARPIDWLAIVGSAHALVLLPDPVVRIGGEEVGSGSPALVVTLGVQLPL